MVGGGGWEGGIVGLNLKFKNILFYVRWSTPVGG